jgi:hypothetical protein
MPREIPALLPLPHDPSSADVEAHDKKSHRRRKRQLCIRDWAKQLCFVRFGEDGIVVSLDGKNFDDKPKAPGSFRVGFNAKRDQPTKLEVVIVAPQR